MAHDREQRRSAAELDKQRISIVVDTGMLPANSVIWKAGDEAEGAGFNYHAFSGVKASWEQANTDKKKAYNTLKSFIDARFIVTLCSYIGLDRTKYDATSDTTLLQLIESKLKPKDSTVYFVKVSSLRIGTDETKSLSVRYQAFADKFIATVSEARDAGSPLLEESVKTAFKFALNSNALLRMWAGAQKWTSLQDTHQRIFGELQMFEAHAHLDTLSKAPAAAAGLAAGPPAALPATAPVQPQQPAAPAIQPTHNGLRQSYTQEQRRDFALQQQSKFAQQQQLQQQQFAQQQLQSQQQQVMVNNMQQSIDSAVQRLNQIQTQPPGHVHHAAPAALFAQSNYVQPTPPAPPNVAQPHPGLDSRGPYWHVHGPHLGCKYATCGASLFCQGCGMHGHTSADCRRTRNPKWNAQGYYSDRYPGAGALQYEARPAQQAFPPPAPPAMQQQFAMQPPRIPPPPFQQQPAPAFPTPHKLNNSMQRTPAATASPVSVNASTQAAADGSTTGA